MTIHADDRFCLTYAWNDDLNALNEIVLQKISELKRSGFESFEVARDTVTYYLTNLEAEKVETKTIGGALVNTTTSVQELHFRHYAHITATCPSRPWWRFWR